MKLPPLNALRAFECAARTGSFSAAGDEMGVSSAAVSMQVRNLERWLGLKLFLRRANRIRLTDAGRDYYQNAASALTEIAGFTQTLTEGRGQQPLVISATPALAQLWLPERLEVLLGAMPSLPVRLRIEDDSVDPETEGIDARLTYGGEHPDYLTRTLFADRLVPVAVHAGMHPSRNRLIEVDWGASISTVPGWSRWFAATGDRRCRDGVLSAPSVPAAVELAAAGLGVALLPEVILASTFRIGRLQKLGLPGLPMPRPYVMVTAHHRAGSRRLRVLAGALGVR